MTDAEIKVLSNFNSKVYEKMSMRDIVNKFNAAVVERGGDLSNTLAIAKNKIRPDLYAYEDSNGRWRAGRLAKQNTGQFVSKGSAGSLRGNAIKQIEKIDVAYKAVNKTSTIKTVDGALTKSYELTKKYKQNVKLNPNAKKSVVYGNTVNDVFGHDWTES